MTDGGLRGVADGLVLQLSGQSFAARALIGSLAAALLAAAAVRFGWVRSSRARRGLISAPIITAVIAAVASAGDAFLPSLVVPAANGGEQIEWFGETYFVDRLGWLLIAYSAIASFLLLRRLLSHLAIRAYVRRARPAHDTALLAMVRRLSSKMRLEAPPLLLSEGCPGGACTTGLRKPVICLDPALADGLDAGELEGLLAHELAHIARRDVSKNVLLGVIRDLTFFVGPLHVAARWIRLEQEHAADDLASASTGRPAALASSILKAWESTQSRGGAVAASMACATMVPAPLLMPAGMPSRMLRQGGLRGGAKLVAGRVVRLIDGEALPSRARERVELVLLAIVFAGLSVVTVTLPAQLAGPSLVLGSWSRPVAAPVTAPAMATFLELAPSSTTAFGIASPLSVDRSTCQSCLTMESPGEWRTATVAAPADRSSGWNSDVYAWQDGSPILLRAPRAEPLWGVDAANTWVGVAIVR